MTMITKVRIAIMLNNSAKIAPSGFFEVDALSAGTMGEVRPDERAMK